MNLEELKRIKNRVIGNPSAKSQVASDPIFIAKLVQSIRAHGDGDNEDVRTEAEHIVGSIAHGSDEALFSLLRADALGALVIALNHSPTLARTRALRSLVTSLASLVGPSQWGLRPDPVPGPGSGSGSQVDPRQSLDWFYTLPSTDLWLPLLSSPSSQIASTIASLISTSLLHPSHRAALTNWVPPSERAREEQVRARRGWEKPKPSRAWEKLPAPGGAGVGGNAAGWVLMRLLEIGGFERKARVDSKTLESTLLAIAALSKDNPAVANLLVRPLPLSEGGTTTPTPLLTILAHARSRLPDVQIAACLCATHIIRSVSPTPSLPSPPVEDISTAARTIINVVGRMISPEDSDNYTHSQKTRACFVLYYLTTDDPALSELAFDRGSHVKLALLLQAITPYHSHTAPSSEDPQGSAEGGKISDEEWEEDEPGGVSALREAALTALASISLFSNDIRRSLTEDNLLSSSSSTQPSIPTHPPAFPSSNTSSNPSTSNIASTSTSTSVPTPETSQKRHTSLLTILAVSLSSPHIGVRYGACQCVRALSRSVAVLRTNIIDSGLGMAVFRVLMGTGRRAGVGGVGGGVDPRSIGKAGAGAGGIGMDADKAMPLRGGEDRLGVYRGEDRRVVGAALRAVCNVVCDFSPLRQTYLDQGLIPRLVEFINCEDDDSLRLNAVWAVKNLLRKTSTETKREVMKEMGWGCLIELLEDPDIAIQEQAFNIVRNISENEQGVEMLFEEIGEGVLLGHLTDALGSEEDDVVLQAAHSLANLINGSLTHHTSLLTHPTLLSTLRTVLSESKSEIRRPVVACVLELVRANPKCRKELVEAGIGSTLRHICEWSGGGREMGLSHHAVGSAPPGSVHVHAHTHSHSHMHTHAQGVPRSPVPLGGGLSLRIGSSGGLGSTTMSSQGAEDDRDVVDTARVALDWLEHGDVYTSSPMLQLD